ncbi:hypothetical protein [Paenibacillus rhizophilus]|uniref:Uncharacterized protein n=1 Tax=Paenibacillus rhizophilus TaxID=1850366 RepID=A0A3N9P2I6_9BACL|nr:hypothetical protein [Paenibacillus rhizophilus]RQW10388.1 hypothetical protein EH198_16355 [Paenibacillus rhizophilus]
MKTRDERIRYVIQHRDGSFLNVRGERKSDFMSVDRWANAEDIDLFLHGHYAPDKPEEYHAQPVRITYELEVSENVQQK